MASFAAQAALRAKWSDLVEGSTFEIPEVSSGVKSVVGWLKQVCFKSKKKRKSTKKKNERDKYKAPDMLLQYFCFLFFFSIALILFILVSFLRIFVFGTIYTSFFMATHCGKNIVHKHLHSFWKILIPNRN